MAVHVRAIDEAEVPALHLVVDTAFGETQSDEDHQDEREWLEPERALAAEEDGRFVGAAAAYTFRMTVPGGDAIPAAGVTWVAVLPTHRRRGVLTSMMRRQLDDVVERGEPMAVLTASDASIYGRFGYGRASRLAKVKIDTATPLTLVAEPACGGRFRLVSGAEAEPHARRLVDEVRTRWVGELTRPDRWWPGLLRDRESKREGASARLWVLHESSAGDVDGVVHYRIKHHWGDDDAIARNEVQLGDVWAPDPEVEAALLVYLAEIDLTASVTTWARPVDDTFRLRLLDDRRYRVELIHDALYVRVLDVPAALTARSYETAGTAVLGIDDPFRPATSGRYRLETDGDKASCERIGDLHGGDADVFLTVDTLGALYLGDVTVGQLADAGRVRSSSAEAVARVDRLFRTPRPPFCTMRF